MLIDQKKRRGKNPVTTLSRGLEEELRRAVTNEAIALHLAQAKASFPRPTFCRLSRQRRTWSAVRHHRSRFSTVIEGQNGSAGYAPRTGMHLVHDHVF